MLLPFKAPSLPPKDPLQPTISPLDRPVTPLDIPELLHLIFSYLDPFTLAKSVVLVCRQWLLLSHRRLGRTVAWDINWQHSIPKYALSRLPGAERLELGCVEDNFCWRGPNVLGALKSLEKRPNFLWSALAPLLWRQDKQAAHIKQLLDQPLRHLVLTVSISYYDSWLCSMHLPTTLTSLTVKKRSWIYIDVHRILLECPLLESLHLFCTEGLYFHGALMKQRKKALPDRLRLRSLVLEQPWVQQSWMEYLLTLTPNLKELQLITITCTSDIHWEWPRFRDRLKALALPLERFHFSVLWKTKVNKEYEKEVFAVCPRAQEHSILAYYMTPWMFEQLMKWPVFLTTLEILQPQRLYCRRYVWLSSHVSPNSSYSAWHWHRLLCQCPNLRHLKTLKMPYMPALMDLHRRSPMYSSISPLPLQPGVWICRGLKTLHMELHVHENATMRGSAHTRVVYGYLSRICPRLQDLRVTIMASCESSEGFVNWNLHPFVLEGGLCLLSRLKYLERLRVDYNSVECEIAELNWLCRSGRNEEHRARRRQLVEGWTWRLEQEAALDMERLKNRTEEERDVIGVEENFDNLMMGLTNLGLLLDVKDVLLEMDRRDFEYLPELQEVACGNHLPQRPEKEIRSLFYMKPPGIVSRLAEWSPF